MRAIGGYFELELPRGHEFHQHALRLNTGRNAFEYLLRSKEYDRVFLPHYTCDAMLEPIHKLGLDYSFYNIDETLRPVFNYERLGVKEVFVYTNYFGVCDLQVGEVAKKCKNLIIDNSQAFFSAQKPNVDTFYSPRKFFGVPDGAYLYTNGTISLKLIKDNSIERFDHLIKRIDGGSEIGYAGYKHNEASIANQPIKLMSGLTQRILKSIDYTDVAERRRKNYRYFHSKLKSTNGLSLNIDDTTVPLVYPYYVSYGNKLKTELIAQKIYVPTYWPNVLKSCQKNSFEYQLANKTVFLPIDQRYGADESNYMFEKLKELIK